MIEFIKYCFENLEDLGYGDDLTWPAVFAMFMIVGLFLIFVVLLLCLIFMFTKHPITLVIFVPTIGVFLAYKAFSSYKKAS